MVKIVIATILAGMVLIIQSRAENNVNGFDEKRMRSLLPETKTNKGRRIFEGDILHAHHPIKAFPRKRALWSDRVIPYEFHHSVNQSSQGIVRQAMDNWEKVTCLNFVPQTNQKNFLRFRTDRPGCSSFVGRMQNFEGQDINLGNGCMHLRAVMHEIGHSLGLIHEHSRKNRRSVIEILWHNIKEGVASQFGFENDDRRDVPYDLTSVMHYSPMAFSKKRFERNTIVTRNPHHQRLVGSSQKISFRDAERVNKMYSCNAFCPNLLNETQQCQNGGYLSPYRGNNSWCHCICPPETYGTFCENTGNAEYYSPPICGGNVTEEQEIQTPGYPKRESPNDSCSWWIQAPPRKRVMVTFLDFSFYPRDASKTSKYRGRCMGERVEIRTISMVEGKMHCGEDIKPGSNLASQGAGFMIIITTAKTPLQHYQNTRGLKAKVFFID